MLHTIYLDDATINGRKMLEYLRRHREGVQFGNPAANNSAPEGYMTLEDFRKEAKASLTQILNEHGIY
jgi:hypothetical protein